MARVIMLFALWVGMTSPALATEWRGGSPEDRAAIQKIIDDWRKAYAEGNAQVVADGYDPKGFVMAEGAPVTYPDVLGPRLAKTFEAARIDMLLDVEEVEFNGTWAFIQGTFASKRTAKAPQPGEEPRYHAGRSFTLMRKTDVGWKVWRNMDTSSPDARPLLEQLKAGK
jgi:ketosteroid isomerase-like protein